MNKIQEIYERRGFVLAAEVPEAAGCTSIVSKSEHPTLIRLTVECAKLGCDIDFFAVPPFPTAPEQVAARTATVVAAFVDHLTFVSDRPAPYSTREAMRDAGLPNWEMGKGLSSADAIRELARQRDELRVRLADHLYEVDNARAEGMWEIASILGAAVDDGPDDIARQRMRERDEARAKLREHEEDNVRLQTEWTRAAHERDTARRLLAEAIIRSDPKPTVKWSAPIIAPDGTKTFTAPGVTCVEHLPSASDAFPSWTITADAPGDGKIQALFDRTRNDELDAEGQREEEELVQMVHEHTPQTPVGAVRSWKELSESTGLHVLTLPDGSTLSSDNIYMVRPFDDMGTRRCGIWLRLPSPAGDGIKSIALLLPPDEDGVVLELATRAHRMHGIKS